MVVGDVNVNPGWQRCVLDAKTATITGKTADADYAGKIIIDSGMDLGGNTTFKNIGLKFDSVTSYYHLFANGHDLTIDEGVNVEMWPGAEIGGTYYPPMARIYGGSYNAPSDGNVNITVKSGTFSHISAGGYGADATGDATITITGTASVTTGISGAGTGGSRTGNRVLNFNAGTEQAPVTVKWMECFDQINVNGGALVVAPGEGDKLEEIGNISLAQGAVLGFANGEAINGNFAGGGKLSIASGKTLTIGGAVSGQTELVISGDAASGTYVTAANQGQAEGGFTTAQQGVTLTKEQNGEAASWVVTSETALPTITQDLAPETPVTYGQDVVLTVAAVGANSYQWQKAPYDAAAEPDSEPVFSDLEGEVGETLTLTKPGISGGVYYRCVVKNANGEVTSNKTLVTVEAAQVTITVQNQVIAKGEALPAFTYKVSGLLGGDALITPPSISAPDGANQTAGSYEITAQGADAGENYTIAYLPGTLVVTEEPLAVSVKVTDQAKDFEFFADENQIKSAVDLSSDAATADVTGIALELSITDGQGDAATQAQDLAKKLMAENEKAVVGSPIDIALWKTVSISGAAQTPVALGEMKQPVAITLTLPASLVGKQNYGIVRVSDGIAESLPVTLSGMNITFETDHFSYFFLTYEEPSGGSSGSSTSWYTVVFKSNGGSAVSSQRVRRGFLVSQPKNPTRSGYTFDGWYSDPNLRYAYDFSDPLYGDLTLYAKWKDKSSGNDEEEPDPDEPTHKCDNFTDIARHWAKDAICYVTENGLFEGMTKTTFAPDGTMTRAMFVTVMGRLSGTKGAYTDKFYDVPDDAYYAKYVGWAVNNGIVLGMDEHTFAPNEPITREQMAALMYRFAEYNGNDVSDTEGMAIYSFEDYDDIAPWARVYVRYCLNAGLLQGRDNGCFDPQADATRAEVATILQRFMKKIK